MYKFVLTIVLSFLLYSVSNAQYYGSSNQAYNVAQGNAKIERFPGPSHPGPHPGCMMCLGNHLIGSHGMSYDYLNSVGYVNWQTLHDNLHNRIQEEQRQVSKLSLYNETTHVVLFLLNKKPYSLNGKETKVFNLTKECEILFHRGGEFHNSIQTIFGGKYRFYLTPIGWELNQIIDPIYAPTPQFVVEAMLRIAKIRSADKFVDLGSGDGRIPITAAKIYGIKANGVEIKKDLVDLANKNIKENKLENKVKIYHCDMFNTTLKNTDIVTLYLEEDLNQKLIPLLKKMKKGSRIISYAHPIPGMKYSKIHNISEEVVYNFMPDLYNMAPSSNKIYRIYLYIIGEEE